MVNIVQLNDSHMAIIVQEYNSYMVIIVQEHDTNMAIIVQAFKKITGHSSAASYNCHFAHFT